MKTIYLSPSTQEKNIGFGEYGTEEYRMNILADKIQNIFKQYNIQVHRNSPNWNLGQIVSDSNYYNVDLHLALHSNADDKKAQGCEVFCHKFGGEGHRIAKIIYDKLSAITPVDDRGIKEGYNFYGEGKHMYELANTTEPAVLVEVSFHDNKYDADWIIENIDKIADTICDGILESFDIKKIEPSIENNVSKIPQHKLDAFEEAFTKGLFTDYEGWKKELEKPMESWAVMRMILNAMKK